MTERATPIRPYRSKRLVDWIGLGFLAVPAVVCGTVCALAIRCSSRGPVLFRQMRVGRDGELYELLKFRTMVDRPDNPVYPDASRITAVGRVLRGLSLDELPQLINVARGDMSIVGPRPALPYQLERFDSRQRQRHRVRPGLTGLAQVTGRNRITWAERIEADLDYIARQGIWMDLTILARTPGSILGGDEGHPAADPLVATDEPGVTPRSTSPAGDDR